MEYHLVNILILLFLLTCTNRANCSTEITDSEKAAIENGFVAGSALAEALKEGAFTDALAKLGTNIVPFLGHLGPLAGIILAFIPGGDSAELTWGALISTICGSVAAHAISMNMTRTPSSLAKAKNTPPSSIKTTPTNS